MRLCYQSDVPRAGVLLTFRNSASAPFIFGVVCFAVSAAWIVYASLTLRGVVAWLPAVVGCMIGLLCFAAGWAALRPTNWLMKDTEQGLYVSLRSYLNHHLPEDGPTILHLEASDIRQLTPIEQNAQVPMRDGGLMRTTLSFLDIKLTHAQTVELCEMLKCERTRDRRGEPGRRRMSHDYPLRLATPERLRIQWRIRPSVDHAARLLSSRYAVADFKRVKLLPLDRMTPESRELLIREFWELGERPLAVRMARRHLDVSRAAAEGWIDALDADD